MSIPIHAVDLDRTQVAALAGGGQVEVMTDRQMVVLLVLADDYDTTAARNGVQIIPVSHAILRDLFVAGHTGWLPDNSPYVFSLNILN